MKDISMTLIVSPRRSCKKNSMGPMLGLFVIIATCIVLALGLSACGGGGGGDKTGPGDNAAPVANAGPNQSVTTGDLVTLNGSGTDADGDTLTYSWSFTSNPGSAGLSDPTATNPTFTPTVDGSYVISLVVNDGTVDSAADTVKITATRSLTLPDTGQRSCYNASGTAISCAGTGQDGDISINPMSFTYSMDNVTGLIWQQPAPTTKYNWYEASGTAHGVYNSGGIDVCGDLVLGIPGGKLYSDWRLPTRKELMSIADYGTYSPAIDTTYFPGTSPSNTDGYWTSITDVFLASGSQAWLVYFDIGYSHKTDKTMKKYVRCVRGSSVAQSFTDNGNGTVTDNSTGLMWQAVDDNATRLWGTALNYCNNLTLADYSDWRLPNVKELASLTDLSTYNPALEATYFPGVNTYYWSSTTAANDPGYAWVVNFGSGTVVGNSGMPTDKSLDFHHVRCVR